jgi:hypothetical protein
VTRYLVPLTAPPTDRDLASIWTVEVIPLVGSHTGHVGREETGPDVTHHGSVPVSWL